MVLCFAIEIWTGCNAEKEKEPLISYNNVVYYLLSEYSLAIEVFMTHL